MRKIIALALAIILSTAACATALAEPMRVGMECDYAPFNWTQTEASETSVPIESGGYADGYDVQIARLIADALGRELVIVKTEWSGLPMALMSGMIDAIIAGMSPTEERKATLDFSDSYYESDLVIVVRGDSEYAKATQLSDFAGAKITGQQNTFHYTVIEQIEGVDIQPAMETFPAMIVALSSGRIDGYVSERPGAVYAITSNPELSYVGFAPGEGFLSESLAELAVAVGLRKGDDALRDQINEILAGISIDERNAIMESAILNGPLGID